MNIKLKRAYDKPSANDGYRILVDRIWPRGVSKEGAKIDEWTKEIAPSNKLRKWFGHDPDKWEEFKKRYFNELKDNEAMLEGICHKVENQDITLVYSAKDRDFNNAVALKEAIEKRLK